MTDDRCPRCDGAFHCGIADAGPCACTTIDLDAALLAELRTRYTGCLCLACLRQLHQDPALRMGSAESAPPRQK